MNNSKIQAIRALTLGAAAAATLAAAGATAGTPNSQFVSDGVNKYVVRYPDLDLSKMGGAAALYGRLNHAAGIVCNLLQSRNLGIAAKYRACVAQAIANAVASVNRPLVSQYYESHTKGDKVTQIQLAKVN